MGEGRVMGVIRRAPGLTAVLGIAVVGFVIAVYLTTVHYQAVPLICSNSGLIDCAPVLKSAYSVVPGTQLPITFPGMLWFLVSGALAGVGLARVWRGQPEPARLRLAHFGWSAVGLVSVLYLVYAEIVQLQHLCLWCTVIHLLTLATFLITLVRLQQAGYDTYEPVVEGAPKPARPAARPTSGAGAASHTPARTTRRGDARQASSRAARR